MVCGVLRTKSFSLGENGSWIEFCKMFFPFVWSVVKDEHEIITSNVN